MNRRIVFALAVVFVFGAVSTASARPPRKLDRYNHVARPGMDEIRINRMKPRAQYVKRHTTTYATKRMPVQLQRWRQKANFWDEAIVNTPRKIRTKQATRTGARDRKMESLLTRRVKERARCEFGDCGSVNRHRAKRRDAIRKDRFRNVKRRYGQTSRPATKPEKIEVDARTKARFKKLQKMIMPDPKGCIDAAECMI